MRIASLGPAVLCLTTATAGTAAQSARDSVTEATLTLEPMNPTQGGAGAP